MASRTRLRANRICLRGVALSVLAVVALFASACREDTQFLNGEEVPPTVPPSDDEVVELPSPGEVEQSGVDPIRVGVIMADSGRLSALDMPVTEALEYAVEQLNRSGGLMGRPLEMLIRDSNSELNVAYNAALNLMERGVSAIFVTCDEYFARPVVDLAERERILVIAPCGPEPNVGGVYVRPLAFSTGTSPGNYAEVMAEHLIGEGFSQVSLFVEGDSFATAVCDLFAERFAELGGVVRNELTFDAIWWDRLASSTTRDVSAMLADAANSQFVVLCAAPNGRGRRMFRLLRSSGVQTPVLATSALDGQDWLSGVSSIGSLRVVTEASIFGDDPSNQVNFYFAGKLDDPFFSPERVGWAVTGADGLWLFVRAVNRTGSLDSLALAQAIEEFTNIELWLGSAGYSQDSHVAGGRALRIIGHENSARRLIEVRAPAREPQLDAPQ